MSGVGVIVNARASRVARDPALVERMSTWLPRGHVQVTGAPAEVAPALEKLRARRIDTLAIVGGDGTVGGTLTPFLEVFPEGARPKVLLVAGGTICTIPKSLGARGGPERNLRRLLDGVTPRVSVRPVVCAETPDGARRAGMIWVNGAAVRWLEAYYARPRQGAGAAVAVIGEALGSAFSGGRFARRLFARVPARATVDGEPLPGEAFTALGASGVVDLGLGFRPFHFAGRDPGRIHVLATCASAARLAAELPALRAGFAARSSILEHRAAARLEVEFATPEAWSLDADLFPATKSLRVSAGPALEFIAV